MKPKHIMHFAACSQADDPTLDPTETDVLYAIDENGSLWLRRVEWEDGDFTAHEWEQA